jgi:copper homeostasis protein
MSMEASADPAPICDLGVVVTGRGDVEGAVTGGATGLHLVRAGDELELLPELATVASLLQVAPLPVSVPLRLRPELSTTGGELTRLHGLVKDCHDMGVGAFHLGFLNTDWQLDRGVINDLATDIDERGLGLVLDRCIDRVLDSDRAWGDARVIPGITGIRSAGSARGMMHGLDELTQRVSREPALADLVVANGGLQPEHVPWLARCGVRRYLLGADVRPTRSWKAFVDAGFVRSWRALLDDAVLAAAS